MQATACLLQRLYSRIVRVMSRLDEASILIAAACHDIDHPGKSSSFLTQMDDPIAILYNDDAILEQHHAALTFNLTLSNADANIFQNVPRRTYKRLRRKIIDMILGTEMSRHFEHVTTFAKTFLHADQKTYLNDDDQRGVVRRMVLKVADVSNPARPLRWVFEKSCSKYF